MEKSVLIVIVLAASLCGCDYLIYELQLTPRDDGLERVLTAWQVGQGKSHVQEQPDGNKQVHQSPVVELHDDELDILTKAFNGQKPTSVVKDDTRRYTFKGNFRDTMPNDIGGAGSYVHLTSELGDTWVYFERFRGNNDPAGVLERSSKAVDRLIELTIGWLNTVVGDDAEFIALRHFLKTEFARDMKNMNLYLWLNSGGQAVTILGASDELQAGRFALALHYLVERGYASARDLLRLLEYCDNMKSERELKLWRKIVTAVLSKANISPRFRERVFALFSDKRSFAATSATFDGYLLKTPEYEAILTKWKNIEDKSEDCEPPETDKIMANLFEQALLVDFRAVDDQDRYQVTLHTGVEPLMTDGKWDEKAGVVRWEGKMNGRHDSTVSPSSTCRAVWCKPKEGHQKKLFGKVVLDGQELLDYCMWLSTLNDAGKLKWKAALGKAAQAGSPQRAKKQLKAAISHEKDEDLSSLLADGFDLLFPKEDQ